jgi:pilus assembly protein CpaE
MTSLLLATASEEWEQRVRKAFDGRLNGELGRRDDVLLLGDAAHAAQLATEDDPRVVVLGPGPSTAAALELARHIDDARPDVCVVLVADPTPEVFQQALRAGVRDIVAPDASLAEIRAVVDRALETASRRRVAIVADTGQRASQVITVASPKGGAGKTAIATNLAFGLAQQACNEVVIVDLDLQFGDVANALRLTPEATFSDVHRSLEILDSTTLKAFLTPHPAGLFVLCAPDTPASADEVGAEEIGKVLDLLGGMFRYVVVDTGAGLDETTLAAMDHSTDLLLVCGTDVASARAVRKELEAFEMLGLTTQRRHFVLNRADARVGLNTGDIEATVGLMVDVSIPSSRAVPLSMNQGTPLLESDLKSPVGRSFGELVNRFHTTAAAGSDTGATNGWLRRRKEATR